MLSSLPRLGRILRVVWRYGLDAMVLESAPAGNLPFLARAWRSTLGARSFHQPRGERLREAFEALGPIFVKLGQVLSTRADILPTDVVKELARLQDKVPAFDGKLAIQEIERGLGKPIKALFASFDETPVASASIAQVHFAVRHDDTPVAVKVLRPGMAAIIDEDLALARQAARLGMRFSADVRRLRPLDVLDEFDASLHDELDLVNEASNAKQIKRNLGNSQLVRIPEVYFEQTCENVMAMERLSGIPVSQLDVLREAGVNLKKLAADGVEIFFTQVFRHGFFHADMHPGNIMVTTEGPDLGRPILLDFGIVGSLTQSDKNYLAQNFLAFFERDYRKVAANHIESGWVPANTRVEQLEAAIRACCEPIFDKPLKDIELGTLLLRLFQASRRFNVEIQPQLVLLQKTLLNVEALGRQLDPELDLWVTAKPVLKRWMDEQMGPRAFFESLRAEAPNWPSLLPQLPRLLHQALGSSAHANAPSNSVTPGQDLLVQQLIMEHRRTKHWVQGLAVAVTLLLLALVFG